MSVWRVVETKVGGRPTGVTLVCADPDEHALVRGGAGPTGPEVYDCCAESLIVECWDERRAGELARLLTDANAEPCS